MASSAVFFVVSCPKEQIAVNKQQHVNRVFIFYDFKWIVIIIKISLC
jgi:hypothetical protein